MKHLYFWESQWWHYWILRHEIDEFKNPEEWDNMFSHECDCGMWWFRRG